MRSDDTTRFYLILGWYHKKKKIILDLEQWELKCGISQSKNTERTFPLCFAAWCSYITLWKTDWNTKTLMLKIAICSRFLFFFFKYLQYYSPLQIVHSSLTLVRTMRATSSKDQVVSPGVHIGISARQHPYQCHSQWDQAYPQHVFWWHQAEWCSWYSRREGCHPEGLDTPRKQAHHNLTSYNKKTKLWCPIPGGAQGQVGWGPGQLSCWGGLQGPFQSKPPYDAMIFQRYVKVDIFLHLLNHYKLNYFTMVD